MSQTLALVVVTLASLTYWTAGDTTAKDGDVLFECNFDQGSLCGLRAHSFKIYNTSDVISGEPGPVSDTSGNGSFLATYHEGIAGGISSYISASLFFPRKYTEGKVCMSFSYFKYGTRTGSMHIFLKRHPIESIADVHPHVPTKKWISFKRTFRHVINDSIHIATYIRSTVVAGFAIDNLKIVKGACPK